MLGNHQLSLGCAKVILIHSDLEQLTTAPHVGCVVQATHWISCCAATKMSPDEIHSVTQTEATDNSLN